MKIFNKKYLIIAAAFVILGLAVYAAYALRTTPKLEVSILNVGQGDSVLIKAPAGQNILIDGGPDKTVLRRLAENLAFWDRKIDLLILTHPHDDHLLGTLEALDRYQVKKVLYTGVFAGSPSYSAWLKKIKEENISLFLADRPQTIELGGGARMEILYPLASLAGRSPENLNNSSIVCRLVYGQHKILLMGDAEKETEAALLAAGPDLSADVIKLAHHGSDNATGEDFLAAVKPKFALISVGARNTFGLPSPRTLKKFERLGVKALRTDRDGTIKVLVEDGKIIIKTLDQTLN